MKNLEQKNSESHEDPASNFGKQLSGVYNMLHWLCVDNLSNLKKHQINKDLKQVLIERENLVASFKAGNRGPYLMHSVNPAEEVLVKFLSFYGIDIFQVDPKLNEEPVINKLIFDEPGREYITRRLKEAREETHKPFLD